MFEHKLNENVTFRTYIDWLILSFLAGTINAGGYLACHRFVSHITGFATLSGISLSNESWLEFFGTMAIPLFFLAGVMLSGYLIEKKYAKKTQNQKYAPVMGIVALLLAIVTVGGFLNWFGQFGDPAQINHNFILLACLCGACGLQNAAITSSSGSTIRTTHLTGLTTDLGLGLVRLKVHEMTTEQRKLEKQTNFLRFATIISFTVGSFIGAVFLKKYLYLGFLFPLVISIYLAFAARKNIAAAKS